MTWLELSINTTQEAIDWVCTSLTADASVKDIHPEDVYITEYSGSSTDATSPDWAFQVRLYLPAESSETTVQAIIQSLSSLCRVGLVSDPEIAVADSKPTGTDGTTPSRVHRIGQRFVVLSADSPYHSWADEILLRLNTSFAFGSGFHPATAMSLQLLERYVLPEMHVLDLGCGTGILSVAMAKLGAEVLALDNDETAVQTAQDTIRQNEVEPRVRVMQGSLGQGSDLGHWMGSGSIASVPTIQPKAAFDLIVTNILARVHIALSEDYQRALRRRSAKTGLLITAGFTTDYEQDVDAALTAAGFTAIDSARCNEWVALAHQLKEQ